MKRLLLFVALALAAALPSQAQVGSSPSISYSRPGGAQIISSASYPTGACTPGDRWRVTEVNYLFECGPNSVWSCSYSPRLRRSRK